MTKQPKTMVCPHCGKTVKKVTKQDPNMPNGVYIGVPGSHICKDGKRFTF